MLTPTPEEQKAIDALKRLARSWPKSLWLFAVDGTLMVMQCGKNGERVYHLQGDTDSEGRSIDPDQKSTGGVDAEYVVDAVDIPCDGGDW